MRALVIAANHLRRLLRDPVAAFLTFLLPLLLILVLGATAANFQPRVGLVIDDEGPLARDLVAAIRAIDSAEITTYADKAAVLEALRRDDLEAGVVIPAGYDADLRAGRVVVLDYLAVPTGDGFEVQSLVEAEVAAHAAAVRAAGFSTAEAAVPFDAGLAAARRAAGQAGGVTVAVVGAAGELEPPVSAFGQVASQQLVLFMFVVAVAASGALVQARRLGVSQRMLSTPTPARAIVAGEALGAFVVLVVQALVIVTGSALLFGVEWGDPFATAAIVMAFALVGTGVGLLVGALLRTEQQASTIGVFGALVLAALGGSMVPLEIFPDTLRTVAHAVPHAWANDAFDEVLTAGGGVADVGRELAVLGAFAAGLLMLATWRFRRSITG